MKKEILSFLFFGFSFYFCISNNAKASWQQVTVTPISGVSQMVTGGFHYKVLAEQNLFNSQYEMMTGDDAVLSYQTFNDLKIYQAPKTSLKIEPKKLGDKIIFQLEEGELVITSELLEASRSEKKLIKSLIIQEKYHQDYLLQINVISPHAIFSFTHQKGQYQIKLHEGELLFSEVNQTKQKIKKNDFKLLAGEEIKWKEKKFFAHFEPKDLQKLLMQNFLEISLAQNDPLNLTYFAPFTILRDQEFPLPYILQIGNNPFFQGKIEETMITYPQGLLNLKMPSADGPWFFRLSSSLSDKKNVSLGRIVKK